jgi:hypothetical protein
MLFDYVSITYTVFTDRIENNSDIANLFFNEGLEHKNPQASKQTQLGQGFGTSG